MRFPIAPDTFAIAEHGERILSNKWTAVIALFVILFVGAYFGSPYYAAKRFRDAAMSADADRLDETVDFPAVRENLKSQLSAAMMRKLQNDTSMKNNPFAGLGMMMAPAIIDKAVDAYITPEGISALIKGKKPGEPKSTEISRDIKFTYEWVSLDRFRVRTENERTNEEGPAVLFERRGIFTWKLIRFALPSTIFGDKDAATPVSDAVEPVAPPAEPGPTVDAAAAAEQSAMPDPAVRESESIDQLKSHWMALDEECRGGKHAPEDAVCTGRDNAEIMLEKRGVCWAYRDENVVSADYKWHPCSEARPD